MPLIQPQTGSVIQTPGTGNDATFTGISTQIVIKVNGTAVGAIQSISVKESRSIAMIDEVGTDGHIDSVPMKSTNITGSCTRTRFDLMRIAPAFSKDFIHVHA